MSQRLRIYSAWFGEEVKSLHVGAFFGGDVGGSAIQLTIGSEYACLSEEQILDLISVLSRRLICSDKWNATGSGSEESTILSNGKKGVGGDE